MTDQPSTQEPRKAVSQWVGNRYVTTAAASEPAPEPSPPTQEAEKALETLAELKHDLAHGMSVQGYREGTMKRLLDDYDAALRSLRTQHTEQQKRIEEAEANVENLLAFLRETRDTMRTGARGYQMARIVDNVLRKFEATDG